MGRMLINWRKRRMIVILYKVKSDFSQLKPVLGYIYLDDDGNDYDYIYSN